MRYSSQRPRDLVKPEKQNVSFFADFIPSVEVKAVKAKARAYLFRDRQDTAQAQTTLQAFWHEAFTQIRDDVKITSRFAFTEGLPSSSILGGPCQRRSACAF
jgi:hypothetical protein